MQSAHTPSLDITWQQPNFLLPLFCLCTLLGSTQSLSVAVGMSAAVTLTTVTCSLCIYALSKVLHEHSTMHSMICGATLIALLELLLHANFYPLYRQLGLFLPLSVIGCLLLARHKMHAQQNSLRLTLKRALLMSAGYALAALVLGAGRELVGHGSLFADAGNVLGNWAKPLQLQLFRADMGFLLAVLAPGAFVGLGLGVALYNWLWLQLKSTKQPA